MTFTCTVPSLGHGWEIPSLNISRDLVRRNKNKVMSDPPFQFAVTEVRTGSSITSTATVNATEDLNGTLVMCQDGFKKVYPSQNSTINIIGEHCIRHTTIRTCRMGEALSKLQDRHYISSCINCIGDTVPVTVC